MEATPGILSGYGGALLPIVTLDVGYRFSPHWYVGLYVSAAYGPGFNCSAYGSDTAGCSETDYRVGVDAEYRFLPTRIAQP